MVISDADRNQSNESREAIQKKCPECHAIYPLDEELCANDMAELVFEYASAQSDEEDGVIDSGGEDKKEDSIDDETIPTPAPTSGSTEQEAQPIPTNNGYDSDRDKLVADGTGGHIDDSDNTFDDQPDAPNDEENPNEAPQSEAEESAEPTSNEGDDIQRIFDEIGVEPDIENEDPQYDKVNDFQNDRGEGTEYVNGASIPYELSQQGYTYKDRLVQTSIYEEVLVNSTLNNKDCILRLYYGSSLSSPHALDNLVEDDQLATILIAHGRDNINGYSRDWELIDRMSGSIGLREAMDNHANDLNFAINVAEALTRLAHDYLQVSTIISIEPEFILYNQKRCELGFFGCINDLVATSDAEYLPRLEQVTTISNTYRAPELCDGYLYRNSVMFSIAQIVVEIVFGQPMRQQSLAIGDVPFVATGDERLQNFLMGCLYPRSNQRWTIEEAIDYFDNNTVPTIPSWASLGRQACGRCLRLQVRNRTIECWTPLELARAITPESWDACIATIEDILRWLEQSSDRSLAQTLLQQYQSNEITGEYVLVAIKRALCPDEPLFWRELSLNDIDASNSIISLAQSVIEGDETAKLRLKQLHNANLANASQSAFDMAL